MRLENNITRRLGWKPLLGAASAIAVVSWLALLPPWRSPRVDERSDASAAPAATDVAHDTHSAPAGSQLPAAPATTPDAVHAAQVAALRTHTLQALASDNAGDRIEALRAVRDAGALELLPDLLALDLARDPDAAPTLISVCGSLAERGDEKQREATATRFAYWLDTEMRRDDPDARANQSLLVEALGRLPSPVAASALERALASNTLPIYVGTLAAEGLAGLGAATARPVLEQFRGRVAAQPAADSFQRELNAEALAAADRALHQLSR